MWHDCVYTRHAHLRGCAQWSCELPLNLRRFSVPFHSPTPTPTWHQLITLPHTETALDMCTAVTAVDFPKYHSVPALLRDLKVTRRAKAGSQARVQRVYRECPTHLLFSLSFPLFLSRSLLFSFFLLFRAASTRPSTRAPSGTVAPCSAHASRTSRG